MTNTPDHRRREEDDDHPFDRLLAALRARGAVVRLRSPDSARATCPTHLDRRPSLSVTRRPDRVLVRCFAGCRTSAVVSALGLLLADLFCGPPPRERQREIVAEYPYETLDDELLAQKVRLTPKGFRWRVPDESAADGWRWGLHGRVVDLYRAPELMDWKQVLLVEGEKAVDVLWRHRLPSTCPPAGASTWSTRWTDLLWRVGCCDVVVLPDGDLAGRRHAARVAAACYNYRAPSEPWGRDAREPWCSWPSAQPGDPEVAPLCVRVVDLPDLTCGADVVDWLSSDHSADELRELILTTPDWRPEDAQRIRLNRTRALTRERVRRFRARQHAGLSRTA